VSAEGGLDVDEVDPRLSGCVLNDSVHAVCRLVEKRLIRRGEDELEVEAALR
jgi:hypothetical protein